MSVLLFVHAHSLESSIKVMSNLLLNHRPQTDLILSKTIDKINTLLIASLDLVANTFKRPSLFSPLFLFALDVDLIIFNFFTILVFNSLKPLLQTWSFIRVFLEFPSHLDNDLWLLFNSFVKVCLLILQLFLFGKQLSVNLYLLNLC